MYEKILLNIILFAVVQSNAAEVCNTSKNEPGECVLLKSCPTLLEMLKDKTCSSLEYVRNSICGFDGTDFKVWCVYQSNPNNPVGQNEHKQNKRRLLANRTFCGYQHSDDYEHKSSGATINEFPWLARIFYRKREENPYSYKKQNLCMGSLLNIRYVLTAAQCTVGLESVLGYIPMQVQLGEYDSVNDTDCVSDHSNIKECSHPTIWYGIEKVIAHREYSNRPPEVQVNDISLIRLNDSVTYSDYVRPICLPYPGTIFADIGNTLITSGWGSIRHWHFSGTGIISSEDEEVTIKKKVLHRLISNNECSVGYIRMLTEKHMCTLASENSTEIASRADSGGPAIFQHKLQWHQEGIVSVSVRRDAETRVIHTRVEKYLDWIEENIEP